MTELVKAIAVGLICSYAIVLLETLWKIRQSLERMEERRERQERHPSVIGTAPPRLLS